MQTFLFLRSFVWSKIFEKKSNPVKMQLDQKKVSCRDISLARFGWNDADRLQLTIFPCARTTYDRHWRSLNDNEDYFVARMPMIYTTLNRCDECFVVLTIIYRGAKNKRIRKQSIDGNSQGNSMKNDYWRVREWNERNKNNEMVERERISKESQQ